MSTGVRSRYRLLVTAVIAALSPGLGSAFDLAQAQVRIELRSQFLARHSEVALGDVAILHARDLPTIQRLSALPLGRAPMVGAQALVRRDAIARWVRSQLGIRPDQVRWSGPEETHVRTLAQEVPAGRIERAAKAALGGWLAERTSRHRVEAVALAADVSLPPGQVALKARPLPDNAEPKPRMVVWIDVEVDGRYVRTVPVSLVVEAYREAWVAPKVIASGVALSEGIIERREVELTRPIAGRVPTRVSPSAQAADSWRTTRPLQEGEILTARNIAPAPAVARGDWVTVQLRAGLVELEGRAEALQDGEMGQVVKVRSSHAATPMEARIVAPGRLEARP